jgi:hypothetical protein
MRFRSYRKWTWFQTYCRIGIASLSALYILMGTLTALSALGLGGKRLDQKEVVPWLFRQPMGRVAVVLLAAGISGYVLWRLVQAWKDPGGFGAGPKGICIRASYLISGLLYASLVLYSIRMAWEDRSRKAVENAPILAGALLQQPHGRDLVRLTALIIFTIGLVQFYRALTERFRKQIPDAATNRKYEGLIRWTGRLGFGARGVVLVIIARLFQRAAAHADAREAGGVGKAWDFLGTGPWGPEILAVVAGCLAVYGVFLAIKSWGLQRDLKG